MTSPSDSFPRFFHRARTLAWNFQISKSATLFIQITHYKGQRAPSVVGDKTDISHKLWIVLALIVVLSLTVIIVDIELNKTPTVVKTILYSEDPGASGDNGVVYGENEQYSTAHDSGYIASTNVDLYIGQTRMVVLNYSAYIIYRSFLKFDTSSIPIRATITAAKLCLYGVSFYYNTAIFYIRIQKWTADTSINTGDYNSFDGTNYDDGAFSTLNWSITGYNNITISNFGLITKGGNTLICVRSSRDINNTLPTGNEAVTAYSYDKGAGYRPLLEVTYTLSG